MFKKINLSKNKCQDEFDEKLKIIENENENIKNYLEKKKIMEKEKNKCKSKESKFLGKLFLISDKCLFINSSFLLPIIISYVIPKSVVGFYDISEMVKKIKTIKYIKKNYSNKNLKKQIVYYYNTYVKFIISLLIQVIEIIGCLTSILCIYKMTAFNEILFFILISYTIYNIVLISVGVYLLDYWNKLSNNKI